MPAPDHKQNFDLLIKLLLIGDSGAPAREMVAREPPSVHPSGAGVGKSSILVRFADDSFTQQFIATIGCARQPARHGDVA